MTNVMVPRVRLTHAGVSVSRLGLGTYNFGGVTSALEAERIFRVYQEHGGNFIDTANSYNGGVSEGIVGRLIRGIRHEFFVATKVGWPLTLDPDSGGLSRGHILSQCEFSLRRLGTDYIDLYQLHRSDPRTPIEETLLAVESLISQGKVRYIGSSLFSVAQISEALEVADTLHLPRFITEQAPYNILDRRPEVELFPFCQARNIAVLVWSPLAGGILSGKYTSLDLLPSGSRVQRDPIYHKKGRLTDDAIRIAKQLFHTPAEWGVTGVQLVMAWVLWNGAVACALAGPRTAEQLEEVIRACDLPVMPEVVRFIDSLIRSGQYVSPYYDVT